MGLYIFIQLLLQIQLYRNNTKKSHFFIEMKISYTLFLTVMVAITIERCRAEYLLVAVDDDVVREPNNDDEIRRQEIEELRQNDICEIKPCCCDCCYPCDYELLAELRKIAEERKAAEQQKAVEPKIVPTPRECCKKAGVPAFCLGNCSPSGAMARQGNRINACSKYDTIIEGCFQAAEKMRLPEPELKPIQEQNAPASKEDPGQCIGVCGGICPPCKIHPKEDPAPAPKTKAGKPGVKGKASLPIAKSQMQSRAQCTTPCTGNECCCGRNECASSCC